MKIFHGPGTRDSLQTRNRHSSMMVERSGAPPRGKPQDQHSCLKIFSRVVSSVQDGGRSVSAVMRNACSMARLVVSRHFRNFHSAAGLQNGEGRAASIPSH